MQFYYHFDKVCKLKGISPSALLKKIGKPTSLNSSWKNGVLPSADTLILLSRELGVSIDYLLTGKNHTEEFSEDEKYLVDLFRQIPYKEQMKFMGKLEDAAETKQPMLEIKCSEYRVSAGLGEHLADFDSWDTIEVPDTPNSRRADFALVVSGDSMLPMYKNNDVVLVQTVDAIDLGEIGIFIVDGEGFIKKFGGNKLISVNAEYKDIVFDDYNAEVIRCVGRVLGRA